MTWSKTILHTAFFSAFLIGLAPSAMAADQRGGCRGADRIAIQDLDLTPDPLVEGQPIRAWRVRIKLEGNRQCSTEVEIREGGETVGRVQRTTLRPGITEIAIAPVAQYRFQGGEHCFKVVVDMEGSRREVDASRRFCAVKRVAWSMREPGERRVR